MTSTRRTSLTAATLFVVATASSLAASAVEPELRGADALAALPGSSGALAVATLLHLLAAGTSVGIAIALFPVVRRTHATLAVGSVVFRTVEAVFYAIGAVALLTTLPLARDLAAAPAEQRAPIASAAELVLALREHAVVVGVVAFCTGALLYYVAFYRSGVVPRWLSAWGVVGTLSMLTACVLAIVADRPVTGYIGLALPIAVQEMVFAGWLLIRGFADEPAATRVPALV